MFNFETFLDVKDIDETVAAKYLLHTKLHAIKNGEKRPEWWYRARNSLDWISESGELLLGVDLGGF